MLSAPHEEEDEGDVAALGRSASAETSSGGDPLVQCEEEGDEEDVAASGGWASAGSAIGGDASAQCEEDNEEDVRAG